jgi:hypothetical protein
MIEEERMQALTTRLQETVRQFLTDSLYRYPELLSDTLFNAICTDMMRPPVDEQPLEQDPAYRLIVFLSEYKDCIELPSYEAVYNAYEALCAEVVPSA